ncbi:MAG: cupin domain-containing protein [Geminicoccaceae bacterium]
MNAPFRMAAAEAPAYWFDRSLWLVLSTPEATAGTHATFDVTIAPGAGAAAHAHAGQDEVFYVLSGDARFTVGEVTLPAAPGDLLHVPRGLVHAFTVDEAAPLRVLNYYTPGGFEPFVLNVGTPATERSLPPPDLAAPDPDLVGRWAEAVGLRMEPGTIE